MRCNGSNWAVYSPGSWDGFRNDVWALWAGVIMRLEHHLVGGYVRYISPHIIIYYYECGKIVFKEYTLASNLLSQKQIIFVTLLLIDHLKPFKISTFRNAHWFCTHMVIPFEQVLVASCTTIQIHSNGFRGSIDSPLRSIQTRFCISRPTIQNHSKPFEESTLWTVISPFKTTIANGFKWCINLYENGTKSRRGLMYSCMIDNPLAMAERFSASDLRSDGRVVRMWVRILAATVVLVSLSKTLYYNCFSSPRSINGDLWGQRW